MSVHQQIIKDNIAFVYGRSKELEIHDPDKRVFVKSVKPVEADLGPVLSTFTDDFADLHPSSSVPVLNLSDRAEISSDIVYPSFEHALMASKLRSTEKKMEIVKIPSILEVKRFVAKELKNQDNEVIGWKDSCLKIAEVLLRDKFMRNKAARVALTKTNTRPLQYVNDHNDLFWGLNRENKGQNNLGILMMKVRDDIIKGRDIHAWLACAIVPEKPENVSISVTVKKSGIVVDEDGREFERKPAILIGKHEGCDLVSAHPSISRIHAAVAADKILGAVIIDFDSANGTSLHTTGGGLTAGQPGELIPPCRLVPLSSRNIPVSFGASSRRYFFQVETQAALKRKQQILEKVANADHVTPSSSAAQSELTVFVRNLAYETTETDLAGFFAPCGPVTSISLPKDRDTGKSRGIAFVTFASLSGVLQAVGRDQDELLGRLVGVKRSDAGAGKKGPGQGQGPSQRRGQEERGGGSSRREDKGASIYGAGRTVDKDRENGKEREGVKGTVASGGGQEEEYDYSYYMRHYGLNDAEEEAVEGPRSGGGGKVKGKDKEKVKVNEVVRDSSPPRKKPVNATTRPAMPPPTQRDSGGTDSSPPRRRGNEKDKDKDKDKMNHRSQATVVDSSPPRRHSVAATDSMPPPRTGQSRWDDDQSPPRRKK